MKGTIRTGSTYNSEQLTALYKGPENRPAGNFEGTIKDKFLSGILCGPIPGVEYYLTNTQNNDIELKEVNEIDKLWAISDKYKYYVLDACISIQNSKKWTPQRLSSLCDLWDPAPKSMLSKNDLIEFIKSLNTYNNSTDNRFVYTREYLSLIHI